MRFNIISGLALLTIPLTANAVPVNDTSPSSSVTGTKSPVSPAATPSVTNATDPVTSPEKSTPNCTLTLQWIDNWRDGIYHRYRVKATAEQGNFDKKPYKMLKKWCDSFFRENTRSGGGKEDDPAYRISDLKVYNTQCWLNSPTEAFADLSTYIGAQGHENYVRAHEKTVDKWNHWSGHSCEVVVDF